MRTVLVYRDDLLPPSEGFVTEPLRHLTRHRPVLVATRTRPGYTCDYPVHVVRRHIPGPTKLGVAAYRLRGPSRSAVRELAALSPRLVHAHFGVDAVQALPLARRLGLPLVTTFHGYDVLAPAEALSASHRGRTYLVRRAELARSGALFLAVSDYLRDRLLASGFPPDRTRTHYVGVDLDELRPAGGPRTGVLFVGRLVPGKGVDVLLTALARMTGGEAQPELTVVGDGPAREPLQRLAGELRVPARFLGSRPRAVVVQEMTRAAVLCLPTRTEALGLVTVEAQATALPVVASRVGGVPEAVLDGETGLLVEPDDPDALAAALGKVLTDPGLQARLGAAGRRHVERTFDLRARTALLEQMYDELAP